MNINNEVKFGKTGIRKIGKNTPFDSPSREKGRNASVFNAD